MLTLNSIIKYLLEGLAVAIAGYLVAGRRLEPVEIGLIALTSALTFMILDMFTPAVSAGARHGLGFGLGYQQLNMMGGYHDQSDHSQVNFDSNPELSSVDLKEPNYMGNFVPPTINEQITAEEQSTDIPYRFANPIKDQCPQSVVASSEIDTQYGQTKTQSQWMDWNLNQKNLNSNTSEYKIAPGYYSKYIVQPGYHELVKTSNSQKIDQLSPIMWSTTNPIDRNYFIMKEPFLPTQTEEQNGGAYEENYENPQTTRLSGVLYSGDIIDLTAGDTIMQRGLVNSQIIFDKPLPNVRTNLSKLRIIHAAKKHDPRKQTAIKYGDPVYIKHNALVNNNNQTRFVKYGEKLQSHQDGPLFRVYKFYSKKDPKSTDYIRYGDDILIARGDQTGDQIYLKVESDKSVSSQSTASDATTFGFTLVRVYELYDRNLCVCPQETLYP